MIDRDIRQQLTVAAISGSIAGRWLWLPEHKADSLIAKFKEAGGTVRISMYEQSHRDYLRFLVICIIVCLSWAVNHYRDNAGHYLQSPARQKCQRTEAGERGNY